MEVENVDILASLKNSGCAVPLMHVKINNHDPLNNAIT